MALVSFVLRTCGILIYFIIQVNASKNLTVEPWIVSFKVEAKSCLDIKCKYLLLVNGGEFLGHYSWRLTSRDGFRGSSCDTLYPNYELTEIETAQWFTKVEIVVPKIDDKLYFCLRHELRRNTPVGGQWVHQGRDLFLHCKADGVSLRGDNERLELQEENYDLQQVNAKWGDLSHDLDVNYLSTVPRPSRDEANDVEVFIKTKYIPLSDVQNIENNNNQKAYGENEINNIDIKLINDRNKREIVKSNGNDEVELDDLFFKNENASDVIKADRQIGEWPVRSDVTPVFVEGLRVENSDKEPKIIDDGIPSVLADTKVVLRLFGQGLTEKTVIAFTHDLLQYGQPCKFLLKGEYMAKEGSVTARSALFEILAPSPLLAPKLYICAKNLKPGINDPNKDQEKYLHQGFEHWKMLATHNKLLPLWVSLTLILVCLMFSALFSGLNLGLMSLDRTELKIISNTGTEQERKYARAIMPVRDHGNYLLCSILLGNVAVNSTFTILLDELTSGLFAVIFSTLAIVLLGEITPQAICSRHGLMVGAKSIMVTKAVMGLTAPLAFPVSKLLDYFLGEEIGSVYNRERLKELVKVTTGVNDLDKDEVNIISGALEMRKKTVSDVMTKLEDVFMLPITSILDFETMSEIVKSGYSRIPVYEGSRTNIVTVLFIKDLAFVDPDDNTPLRTLCQYYQNPCNFVFEDVTLDVMFKQFKEGHKGHMAFVHRINNEGEGDPFYETIGLVTLEDVIEEMIQAEIVDETDVFMDNRSKRKRNRPQNKLQDFAAFAERHENQRIHISPQLTLATFQFLSTSVDVFKPDTVSETVLRRLLKQDVIHYIKMKGKTKRELSTYVYQQGKPVDYFVLILEGRVEVTVGRENLVFEAGPFTYFGVQALTQNVGLAESPTPSAMGSLQNISMEAMLRHTFVPDYSVRAVADVYYLAVRRSLYLAAKRATLMEKGALSKGSTNEQFDTEVDKITRSATNSRMPLKLSSSSTSVIQDQDYSESVLNMMELKQKQNIPSISSTITSLSIELSTDENTKTSVIKEPDEISQNSYINHKKENKLIVYDEMPTSSKYLKTANKRSESDILLRDIDKIIDKKRKMTNKYNLESKEAKNDDDATELNAKDVVDAEQTFLKDLRKLQSSHPNLNKKSSLDLDKCTNKEQNAKIKENLKRKFDPENASTSKDFTSFDINKDKLEGIFRSKSKLNVAKNRLSLDEGEKDLVKCTNKEPNAKTKEIQKNKLDAEIASTSKDLSLFDVKDTEIKGTFGSKSKVNVEKIRTSLDKGKKDKKAKFRTDTSLLTFYEPEKKRREKDKKHDKIYDKDKQTKIDKKPVINLDTDKDERIDIECKCDITYSIQDNFYSSGENNIKIDENTNFYNDNRLSYSDKLVLMQLAKVIRLLEKRDLLQSVDEDISISGEHKTPSRQVSPNPVSASPVTRASFARNSPDRHGDLYPARADEQEKLLKH